LAAKFSQIDGAAIFDEQYKLLSDGLAGSPVDFLRILPGKDCLAILLRKLELKADLYLNLICHALRQPETQEDVTFKRLKADLIAALTPLLPSREATTPKAALAAAAQ
jgi:hypothetical protein